MTLSEFITRVNYVLRGTDDDAPVEDSDEWNYWLDTLNRKKDELYQDTSIQWRNTYETRSVGTVAVSSEPAFDTDDDFLAPSDLVYIVTTNDIRVEYSLIQPQERDVRVREAFIAGMNPQQLFLTTAVLTGEDVVGGTIYLPGYYLPADVEDAADDLPFLDPNWAVLAVAAELAGNDIVYEDKEANLTAKANNLYNMMVKKNRHGTHRNPRRSSYLVSRIRGFSK